MTDEKVRALGEEIIELFDLKPLKDRQDSNGYPMYNSRWGTKTALGIGLAIKRIVAEHTAS